LYSMSAFHWYEGRMKKATRAKRTWLETCEEEKEEGSPASLIRLRSACRSVQYRLVISLPSTYYGTY
jgi:hypothetical protein